MSSNGRRHRLKRAAAVSKPTMAGSAATFGDGLRRRLRAIDIEHGGLSCEVHYSAAAQAALTLRSSPSTDNTQFARQCSAMRTTSSRRTPRSRSG